MSEILLYVIAFVGAIVAISSLIIASRTSARLRNSENKLLKAKVKTLTEEVIALQAAVKAQSAKKIDTEKSIDKYDLEKLSQAIENKVSKQMHQSGIEPNFTIDYNELSKQIKSLPLYYKTLEDLYFQSNTGLKSLSDYISQISLSTSPAIVLLDIVAFTEYTSEHGLRKAGDILEDIRSLINNISRKLQGVFVSTLGDSFILLFPDVSRAVEAVISIYKRIKKYKKPEVKLQFRVAIDIGLGDDIPARLQNIKKIESLSQPDKISISKEAWGQLAQREKLVVSQREEIDDIGAKRIFYEIDPIGNMGHT